MPLSLSNRMRRFINSCAFFVHDCGLCGQLGVWTGWVNPSDAALANEAAAMAPTAFDWVGLILISFVLPAVLTWAFGLFFRKIGWIKPGDLTLPQ